MNIRRIDSAAHAVLSSAQKTTSSKVAASVASATLASCKPPSAPSSAVSSAVAARVSPEDATARRLRLLNHSSVSQNISALLRDPLTFSKPASHPSRTASLDKNATKGAEDGAEQYPAMTVQESIGALLRRQTRLKSFGIIEAKELARIGVFGGNTNNNDGRLFELSL